MPTRPKKKPGLWVWSRSTKASSIQLVLVTTGPKKRGRRTLKRPVFELYKRDGRVYTKIVADCSAKTL